jgi:hypothetical protein
MIARGMSSKTNTGIRRGGTGSDVLCLEAPEFE